MKKLIFSLLFSLMLFGCTKTVTYDGKILEPDSFICLESVAEDFSNTVYKDIYTGVLYLSTTYRLSVIMKADGTCLTWDEWVKRGELNETGN